MKAKICPSVLSADFTALGAECQKVLDAGADWMHIDVMDGHFVPNLSMGPRVVAFLRRAFPSLFFDVHLMVYHPEQFIDAMAIAGASQFTFHVEAAENPQEIIDKIRAAGMKPGITLKPKTSVDELIPYLDAVDLVLVMTVEPGFGGQKFMPDMMDKVRTVRRLKPDINISVDGGINLDTIDTAAKAGANCVVAGAIFRTTDPFGMINGMRQTIESAQII
jgi:ribulose-phosphate 3-epimerase